VTRQNLEPEEGELTIDELAAKTRLPSRTIRFYQSKGALPKPIMRGRVAYYGRAHAERLELIATLQDRGLKIRAIRELLERVEKREVDLDDWLGADSRLQAGLANDEPRVVPSTELPSLLGESPRRGLLGDLLRVGLIEESGGAYLVRRPAMLAMALDVERAGFDLDVAVEAHDILDKHARRAGKEVVKKFAAELARGKSKPSAKALNDAVEALVPVGLRAVKVLFARAMREEVREILAPDRRR
jgi:DNA-binding transcriptional MerR regulator